MAMSEYSIVETKDQLSRLIDRMLAGEAVVITRRNRPVARLAPIEPPKPKAPTKVDLEWIDRLRESAWTGVEPTVDTVREMRDDYRY
jgi:prevent-host-death family protein